MLKARVGYSKLEDAYEAGVEAAKKQQKTTKQKQLYYLTQQDMIKKN